MLGAALLVGVVSGLGGVAFSVACQAVLQLTLEGPGGYRPAGPAGEPRFPWLPEIDMAFRPWLLVLLPALGGLVSGWLVFRFAPEAEGHGTDAVIAAYHKGGGFIRPRVPLIKLVASAVTIGTGGSGGREGPIAQIGAGFGSLLATLLRFRVSERRILLAAGMGAGVAAIFRAPLAGTLFAAEVLYWSPEFEPEVILPSGLASVVAYCTFGVVAQALGGLPEPWRPLFETPPTLAFGGVGELIPYTALAVGMAVLAMVYVRTFYGVTHLFHRLALPRALKPALGGLLCGAAGVGLFLAWGREPRVLAVLSFGYGALQEAFRHEAGAGAALLLAVAVGKIVTTSLTIGSGGSGGVFGPSMVIGGCGGGALGLVLHRLSPTLVPHPSTFVVLGMAAFFAAAAKTPFSTLIIVSEMTGDYRLLLPALWVCTLAFLLSDGQPLYQSQVEGRSLSPAHQGGYVREVLAGLSVARFLDGAGAVPTVKAGDSAAAVMDRFATEGHPVLPVVDGVGRLAGVVALDEVHLAARAEHLEPWLLAADLMRPLERPLRPDDRLDTAMELFAEYDLLALPVVDGADGGKVVGLVRRSDVAQAYLRKVQGARHDGDGRA